MRTPATVLQILPKLDTGGAERVAIEIAEALTKAGHRALIGCEGGVLSQAAQRAGAELIPIPLDTKSPLKIRANASRLRRLIKQHNVDILHAHSRAPAWSGLLATKNSDTPFVTTYHSMYKENLPLKRRYNSVMASGDRVIAVSHFIGDWITTRYPAAAPHIRIIPGGVDPAKFDPASVLGDRAVRLATAWRLPAGAPVIMLPGRLTSLKGQSLLIEALAKLRHPDALAVLVGGDQGRAAYKQSLITQAESLGVSNRLRLAGNVEDMQAALMLADIVVNCSTQPEGFGRTIIEAQSMSRMVIAANHGGAAETITDGETGLLVPPNDSTALAEAIDRALSVPTDLRITWGQYIRAQVAAKYSITAMQSAHLAVYAELCASFS